MSLTKKPTNPMTTKPIAVRTATFVNSTQITRNRGNWLQELWKKRDEKGFGNCTFAIGFVTALDETYAILSELPEWIEDGINGVHFCLFGMRLRLV